MTGTEALATLHDQLQSVGGLPQFAMMVAYPGEEPIFPFDAASVSNSSTIQWMCCNSSKPGRAKPAGGDKMQTWVVLTTVEFAESLLKRDAEGRLPPQTPEYLNDLAPRVYQAFQEAVEPLTGGKGLPPPAFTQLHRWGSAFPARPLGQPCVTVGSVNFVACGDYCLGAGIENAAVSGLAAADSICDMFE